MDTIENYYKQFPAIFNFAFGYMQPEEDPDLIISLIKKEKYPFKMIEEYGIPAFLSDFVALLKMEEEHWLDLSGSYLGLTGATAEERYRKLFEVIAELALAERRRTKKLELEKVKEEAPKDPDYLGAGQTLITDLLDEKS